MEHSIVTPYTDKLDPGSSHAQIRHRLAQFPRGTKVLDIGTATGNLGRICQDLGLDFYGVEPNPEWAEIAKAFYREVLPSTFEAADASFLKGYTVVICADVLEHLVDPVTALNRVVSLQQEDCLFLISVPNVANLWVRLMLLFGKFEYTERGILDRTHLRFFTRRSFLHLLHSSGLRVKKIRVTPVPIGLVFPGMQNSRLGGFLLKVFFSFTSFFPTLLGYQFLAEASQQVEE